MRLDRLELKGFMRFAEPVVLDLQDVPAGILAIIGENGAGKSTILDAGLAAPFLEFPSRDGVLADYATERDAYLDVRYSIEGRGTYRARVNVDGIKRTSDAVLELMQPDGGLSPLNDGKVSTFRDQVAKTFPPKELLLASAFAAQNRSGSFVALDKKGRKDLFSALLGLKHYERMAETARRCLDIASGARAKLQTVREVLTRDTDPRIGDDLQARANALQSEGGQAELRRREQLQLVDTLTTEREQLLEQAQEHLAAKARLEALIDSIRARRLDLERVLSEADGVQLAAGADVKHAEKRRADALASLERRVTLEQERHAGVIADLEKRLANNRKVLEDADGIRDALSKFDAAVRAVTELRDSEAHIRIGADGALQERQAFEEKLREVETAERNLAVARRQLETLDTVPCHGAAEFSACRFLTDARSAKASIAILEAIAAAGPEVREGIVTWSHQLARHHESLKERASQIKEAAATAEKYAGQAKLAPHITMATERIADYERQREAETVTHGQNLADIDAQRDQAMHASLDALVDIKAKSETRLAALTTRRHELEAEISNANNDITAVNEDVGRSAEAAKRLDLVEQRLADARASASSADATIAAVKARREELHRETSVYVRKCHERGDIEDRLRAVEGEQLSWQLLAKAFGRDGLPTLEIDAAGPTVSNLTNDLLSVCFGPRFSVELVTQEDKADGKGMKEAFSLRVFDNVAGGDTRDIGDLSGGERVIVEEALRAAIALFVNSRNEMPIRTLWRDETTGALDPENAVRYVAMLRRIQELGGYTHILFITHNEAAAALADARIVVGDGKVEIETAQRRAA